LQLRTFHPWRDRNKLHKLDEIGIGTVHDGDTTRSDLTIDGGETAKENVIEHKDSVLANPVPGRIEVTGFKRVENGLNAINISVAVLTRDAVQPSLNLC
jgi:phosphoribosylformylglycinamidine (FGAM) synthase PurS component